MRLKVTHKIWNPIVKKPAFRFMLFEKNFDYTDVKEIILLTKIILHSQRLSLMRA